MTLPRRSGVTAGPLQFTVPDLIQVGPLAKEVRDVALLLNAIAGYDAKDSTSAPVLAPDYLATLGWDLKGLRVGVPYEYFGEGLDPDVEAAVRGALATLKDLGADLAIYVMAFRDPDNTQLELTAPYS